MVFEGLWPSGIRVRWRLLRWEEHRRAVALAAEAPAAAWLAAYRTALLDGPPAEQAPAGIVVWIGRQLIDNDPFSGQLAPIRQTLDAARAAVRASYLEAAAAVVCHLFHYRPEELGRLDSAEFFRLVAAAELLTGVPVEPSDPSASPPRPKPPGRR